MESDSLESVGPEGLARMLDVEGNAGMPVWSEADAAAALRHQLGAALMPDLGEVAGAEVERMAVLVEAARGAGVATFLEALLWKEVPVELLEGIKAFGRAVREDGASPLCGAGGTVIYYAAIAAGLGRGVRMTKLTEGELREGFEWARGQAGAEKLEGLFADATIEPRS